MFLDRFLINAHRKGDPEAQRDKANMWCVQSCDKDEIYESDVHCKWEDWSEELLKQLKNKPPDNNCKRSNEGGERGEGDIVR